MLARALEKKGVPMVKSPLHWKPARAGAKIIGALNIRHLPAKQRNGPFFCQLNHAWKNAFYPYVLWHPLVTYTFDCWPYIYDEWQEVFELNRPKIAFISARLSVAEMQRRVPGVDFRWLPEAGDPAGFCSTLPLAARPVDVLEMGRSYPVYHAAIREPLSNAGRIHSFPPPDNPIALSYEQAIKNLSEARVLVCFPKTVTDPARAGNLETTTFRYFESIFSKCLMVGHCPAELIEIMGYNPVIEADMTRPAAQLLDDILSKMHEFQPLVEKNYQTMIQKWTVYHQAEIILSALKEVEAEQSKRP
jgi:hypothetical protein